MPDTTIPESDVILDRTGTPSELLAHLQGSWSALTPKGRMVLARVAQPPQPPSGLQLGIVVAGPNPHQRDTQYHADRIWDSEYFPDGDSYGFDLGGVPSEAGEYQVEFVGSGKIVLYDGGPAGPQPAWTELPSGTRITLQPGYTGRVQIGERGEVYGLSVRRVGDGDLVRQVFRDATRGFKIMRFLGAFNLWDQHEPVTADTPTSPIGPVNDTYFPFRATPLDLCIVADECGCVPWLVLPDGQGAEFYQEIARRLKAFGKRVIVEYSNEAAWNRVFKQTHRVAKRGGEVEGSPASLLYRRYANEAMDMIAVIREIAPNAELVLCGQLHNPDVLSNVVNEAGKHTLFDEAVHSLAVAGYAYPKAYTSPQSAATIEQDIRIDIYGRMRNFLVKAKATADSWRKPLGLYEYSPFHAPNGADGWPIPTHPTYSALVRDDARMAGLIREQQRVFSEVGVSYACHMGLAADPATATWYLTANLWEPSARLAAATGAPARTDGGA